MRRIDMRPMFNFVHRGVIWLGGEVGPQGLSWPPWWYLSPSGWILPQGWGWPPGVKYAPMVIFVPLGMNLAPRGKVGPQGWNRPLGVVFVPHWVNFAPRGEVSLFAPSFFKREECFTPGVIPSECSPMGVSEWGERSPQLLGDSFAPRGRPLSWGPNFATGVELVLLKLSSEFSFLISAKAPLAPLLAPPFTPI
jgi:hypothetical protein